MPNHQATTTWRFNPACPFNQGTYQVGGTCGQVQKKRIIRHKTYLPETKTWPKNLFPDVTDYECRAQKNDTTVCIKRIWGMIWSAASSTYDASFYFLCGVATFPPGRSAFTIRADTLTNVTRNEFFITHKAFSLFSYRRTVRLWFFVVVTSRRH